MAESRGDYHQSKKLECSICLGDFKLPKLLPCFHSFCKSCLQTYTESNSDDTRNFNCPLCRCSILLPDNGVDGFQSNFYIVTREIETSESNTAAMVCDICDSVRSVMRCIECDENMCQSCAKSHSKMKIARSHHVAKIGDTDVRIKPKSYCSKHEREEIRFLCIKCDELICINCKLTLHENHTTRDVGDEAKQSREDLSNLLKSEKCTTYVSNMETKLSKLIENHKEIEEKEQIECQKIMQHTEQFKFIVDINSDALVQKIIQNAHDAGQIIITMKEEMKRNMKSYSSLCSSAHDVLEMASDVDTIRFGKNFMKQLKEEIEKLPKDTTFKVALQTEFIPDLTLLKDDRNFIGTIVPIGEKNEQPSSAPKVKKVESYSFGKVNDIVSIVVDVEDIWLVVSRFQPKRKRKTLIVKLDCSEIEDEVSIDSFNCDNLCIVNYNEMYYTSESSIKYIDPEEIDDDPVPFLELQRSLVTKLGSCSDLTVSCDSGRYGQRFIRGLTYCPKNDEFLLTICSALTYENYKSLNFTEKIPGQLVWYKRDGTVKKNQFPKWNTHLKYPTKVAVNANDDIFLVDNGGPDCCLYIFDTEGELKSKFIPKADNGCGLVPVGICCDKNCLIFLSYFGSKRIDMLDKDGTLINHFESTFQPSALHVDEENRLWVGGKRGRLDTWKIYK